MSNLGWTPGLKIEKKYIKKPASGTVAVSGGVKLRAGTPLNSSGAVANTSNAAMLVAEDHIFYTDPAGRDTSVDVITGGYVDINKAEAAFGKSYTDDAKAALAELGIILVDFELSSSNVGAASPSDIPTIPVAANQADSEAETLAALVSDFNDLLAKLKDAGMMDPDPEEIVGTIGDTETQGEPALGGG